MNINNVTKEIEKLREAEQVLDMIKQMEDLVKSTIEQTNQIVEETKTQKNVTVEVEESFHQVNNVSDNLLSISQSGKEV